MPWVAAELLSATQARSMKKEKQKLSKLLDFEAMPDCKCLLKQLSGRCKMQAAESANAIIHFAYK